MDRSIALFGEAEKGVFQKPYICKTLSQLIDTFGLPPDESLGLDFAIQTLLYQKQLVYFRVREEGFSIADYMLGLKELEKKDQIGNIDAICLPGVGDKEIIAASERLCQIHKSFLITTEKDLFDYLTYK